MRELRHPARRYVGSLKGGRKGTRANTAKINIATSTKKYDPTYNLTVTTPAGKTTFARPFSAWFDEQGRLVPLPFQQMLATSIPLIGAADPKRVESAKSGGGLEGASPEMLDAILEASKGTTSGADAQKGGRRRKA